MPFDGAGAPPEWRRAPNRAWTTRDRLIVAGVALLLVAITLGECRILLDCWRGLGHDA